MRVLIVLALVFAVSCGGKRPPETQATLQDEYNAVKNCMGITGPVPGARIKPIPEDQQPEPGKVQCGELVTAGCYWAEKMQIDMPIKGQLNTLRHELVHHFLNATGDDPDSDHNSELFQKCGGVMIMGDVQ